LTALTSSGNGQNGAMFDVVNISTGAMNIGSIDQCFFGAGSNNMYIYTKTGTWNGFQANPGAWTLVGGPVVTPHGVAPVLDPIPLVVNVTIPPGATQAFYVTGDAATTVAYTNGSTAPLVIGGVIASNADLQILGGIGVAYPFGGTFGLPTIGRLFNGRLNYCPVGSGTVFATNTSLGTGCYAKAASFYEFFPNPPTGFDLSNTSFTMNLAGGGYVVTSGGSFIPVGTTSTPVAIAVGDDVESTINLAAMGPLPTPTGPAASLVVCSNGFVSTALGNGIAWTPDVAAFLGAPQTSWRVWHDFANNLGGSVKFEESATVSVITWDNVRHYAGTGVADDSTFQMQFYPSGAVTFAFLTMSTATNPSIAAGAAYLVGYSPGGASMNPGSTDISAALLAGAIITPAADVQPLSMTGLTRPVTGTNWNRQVANIPAGSPFGLTIYGIADPNVPDLGFIGMPGCPLRSTLDLLDGPFIIGGPTANVTFPIPNNPVLVNFHLFTQAVVFTIPPLNAFGAITSNGIDGKVGDF
jgi:hypothetical protein